MTFEEELRERMRDLAESQEQWDDPLPIVHERAAAHRRATPPPRRHWLTAPPITSVLKVAAAVIAVALVLGGIGTGIWKLDQSSPNHSNASNAGANGAGNATEAGRTKAGSGAAGSTGAAGAERTGAGRPEQSACLPRPVASGPARDTARLTVRVLRSATGAITGIRPVLHEGQQRITVVGPIRVLLLAGDRVVGSRSANVRVGSPLAAVPLPSALCAAAPGHVPPGTYGLLVSVGYRTSAGARGTLVSTPTTITVR